MLPIVSPSSLRDETIVSALYLLHKTGRSLGRDSARSRLPPSKLSAGPEHKAAESAEPAQCPAGAANAKHSVLDI